MATIVYIALVLIIAATDAAVTFAVLHSDSYDPAQKRLQVLFIWLLPIVGAAFSWYVLREEARSGRKLGDSGNEYLWWNYPDKHEHNHSNVGHDGDQG